MGTTPGQTVRGALCALAVAVPLLAGCAGAEGEAERAEPSTGSRSASEDAAADLEASAPDGKYAASYVLESANVPGFKPGLESKSTYAFTFDECSDTECSGTVKAPVEGSYTWDGAELVMTFDEIDKTDLCVDEGGEKVEGDTFRMRTEHGRASPRPRVTTLRRCSRAATSRTRSSATSGTAVSRPARTASRRSSPLCWSAM